MIKQKRSSNILNITTVALSVAILSVCSWITIPAFGSLVPFTMQTFAVFVIAGLLGLKKGLLSISVYILLGAVGVPVFTGFRGGVNILLGPTGGYIIGFIFCVFIIGLFKLIKKRSIMLSVISMIFGLTACYTFGTAWFYIAYADMGKESGLISILTMCVFPFIIPDLIKILLAAILVNRLSFPLQKIGFNFDKWEL